MSYAQLQLKIMLSRNSIKLPDLFLVASELVRVFYGTRLSESYRAVRLNL